MTDRPDPRTAAIPASSLVFGYGPMLPLAAAAIGSWLLPMPWPAIATRLAIIWGALILVFVAGVRRGYGFATPAASTAVEIVAMLCYFLPGGLALVVPNEAISLALLILGYLLVIILDRRGAFSGNAPAHFARLRPPQMGIALLSLTALLLY